MLDEKSKADIEVRLKRIEGQMCGLLTIAAIESMIAIRAVGSGLWDPIDMSDCEGPIRLVPFVGGAAPVTRLADQFPPAVWVVRDLRRSYLRRRLGDGRRRIEMFVNEVQLLEIMSVRFR